MLEKNIEKKKTETKKPERKIPKAKKSYKNTYESRKTKKK